MLLFSNGTGLILACYLRAPTILTDSLRADLSTHASDRTVLSKFKLPHNFFTLAVVMCDR
ncbi:hypothetical protein [Microcoleus sp. A2-C5]|uniref:hypothetical protein n=1 Tax=Microcoleus sp. A2-C5 TaxID=2818533 RepID=UPI002FD30552